MFAKQLSNYRLEKVFLSGNFSKAQHMKIIFEKCNEALINFQTVYLLQNKLTQNANHKVKKRRELSRVFSIELGLEKKLIFSRLGMLGNSRHVFLLCFTKDIRSKNIFLNGSGLPRITFYISFLYLNLFTFYISTFLRM